MRLRHYLLVIMQNKVPVTRAKIEIKERHVIWLSIEIETIVADRGKFVQKVFINWYYALHKKGVNPNMTDDRNH